MNRESEKERQRRTKQAFKSEERRTELASCPFPLELVAELVQSVEGMVFDKTGSLCDHSLRLTRSFLTARGVEDVDGMVAFLHSKGGYCDCEVADNVGSWLETNAPNLRH